MTIRAVDLIRAKREGHRLQPAEITWLVEGLADGTVPEYQWASLLMAILWRGMDHLETEALTKAMLRSGAIVDLSMIPGKKVDKHSTGGVGDKTSLVLAPIVAACGVPVPMVSGRGLGHTGGTLDKLESIPGFQSRLNLDRYVEVLRATGLVLIGQTDEIAPADRQLYALRDATATVESLPLLTSSILSKKLAEGIDGLVLDVKTGNGAFLESLEESRALADSLCRIGRGMGKSIAALITRMDQPLGLAVGNAVEVAEVVRCLRGEGPADLRELSIELATEMLCLADPGKSQKDAKADCYRAIADGSALERLRAVIEAQGGDPKVVDDLSRLPLPLKILDVSAQQDGVIAAAKAKPIGFAAMQLGAGRARSSDRIDHAVGILLRKKVGDRVSRGEPLATILAQDEGPVTSRVQQQVSEAFEIVEGGGEVAPLIVDRIES